MRASRVASKPEVAPVFRGGEVNPPLILRGRFASPGAGGAAGAAAAVTEAASNRAGPSESGARMSLIMPRPAA